MEATRTDSELRCSYCASRHPERRAPLLATFHGSAVLIPVRLSQAEAQRLGVPRSGLWWQKAPVVDGRVRFKCRRCAHETSYSA